MGGVVTDEVVVGGVVGAAVVKGVVIGGVVLVGVVAVEVFVGGAVVVVPGISVVSITNSSNPRKSSLLTPELVVHI